MKARLCELCNGDAAVFCPSDAAFLCWTCDAIVHRANFLVAQHLRQPLCTRCKDFTGQEISGAGFSPSPATCSSCPPADGDSLSSSTSSSVCVSSTTKENSLECSSPVSSARKRRWPAEAIFVNWCGELGVEGGGPTVRMACKALKVCLDRWTVLPFRVCLAASMWLGLRVGLDEPALTWKLLKRLAHISGVPAKIILAADSKLGRAFTGGRRRLELQEGSAES